MKSKNESIQVSAHYEDLFVQAIGRAAKSGEPGWLLAARRTAFEKFCRAGFPTVRVEEWKYTDVSAVAAASPALPGESPADRRPDVPFAFGEAARVVFVDGRLVPELSRMPADASIECRPLAEALCNGHSDFLQGLLCDGRDKAASAFDAMHTAFMTGGIFLRARCGGQGGSLHVVNLRSEHGAGLLLAPRIVVTVDPGAELTLVQSHLGGSGEAGLTNAATDLDVGEGASLRFVKLQAEGAGAFHVSATRCRQAAGSRATLLDISLGARLSRHEVGVALEGEGAEARLDGLYALRGRQHADYHTVIDHRVPFCTSRQVYKGILDERSRAVFCGKILVQPGARQTDALQLNKNLLLSRQAVVDTKPQLEIANDDVKCTHGATVGQLDRAQVFYLQSRGIDRAEAESILARGFADDVLMRVGDAGLRAGLHALVGGFFAAAEEHLHE